MRERSADEVRSPCVSVCALDHRDVCLGCYRSVAEIAAWGGMDNEQKRAVLACADRRYHEQWMPADMS